MNRRSFTRIAIRYILVALCVLLNGACSQNQSQGQTVLESVSVDQLEGRVESALVIQNALTRPVDATDATILFSGELHFTETTLNSSMPGVIPAPWLGEGQKLFPSFSTQIVSDGQTLIPLNRGIISTWQNSNSFWDVVVGVGKIWHESDDGQWQRASFPISLVSRKLEQLKNCVALFLYDDTEISFTTIQCSQETCSATEISTQDDMHATVPTTYTPIQFDNQEQIFSDYQNELANRRNILDWSQLDPTGQIKAIFNSNMEIGALSLGAIVMDGEVYMQAPETRHGLYPYPYEMRHSVFSATKSMCGALALLYLAQRYGDDIFDALITDYIPALQNHPGWQGVTIEDVANMVTGTAENDSARFIIPFYVEAASAEECIATIASFPDITTRLPGEVFQYASTHYFVLSYAMQSYVTHQEGEDINYWDLVVENVLKPMGIEHLAVQMTEESDGSKGLPIFGGGAFPTVDEAAKIALLFHQNGEYKGQTILHRERTREALGRSSWQGYQTDTGSRYRHSFWSRQYQVSGCTIDVSYMSGDGGNYVGFLPSGLIILRFTDADLYNYEVLASAAETIRSSCVQ